MAWWGYLLIAIAVVLIIVAILILTGNTKKLKEWLIYAVAAAEKELGSGTGQLKLREVYDKFIARFPILATLISFKLFSKLVDKALGSFEKLLDENKNVKDYVENQDSKKEEE